MLRKIRITLAIICFVLITLLFLDFTGTIHHWFGWLAKIQFWPALLALNVGVVIALLILTLLFGRVYCSVICPLGVFQDVISKIAGKFKKNRFRYSPAISWLRYTMLSLFVVAFVVGIFVASAHVFVELFSPYSAYGRIATNLFAPVYQWSNNLLAYFAERADSYAFYSTNVWMKGLISISISAITFIVVAVLAWRSGRTYCNTICPVGTFLGFISKFAIFKPQINLDECINCGLCAKKCKASCINTKEHTIDYSRCVACMDCIDSCSKNAIKFSPVIRKTKSEAKDTIKQNNLFTSPAELIPVKVDYHTNATNSRRNFLIASATVAIASTVKAQEKKVDGGLAVLKERKTPTRKTKLTPSGSLSARNMAQHCTACQLCISVCPNEVLRPSNGLMTLMQPEMSYEKGYCRPECTKCSEVCPTGAIKPITKEEKTAIQIGHAVWRKRYCIVKTDNVECGNCARHCPNGAIEMIAIDPNDPKSLKFPSVNTERCIGCGACEYVCPARPFSAIHVEGHEVHRFV